MTTASADYARFSAYLDRARLPAYVSFVETENARGIERDSEAPQRIYVRIADGAVVSSPIPASAHVVQSKNGSGAENPFGKPEFFDPSCYVPLREDQTSWNGRAAVRISVKATCNSENGFTEVYAEPDTLRPIAADGDIDTDESITVAVELRYESIGPYTVPESVRGHAVGHGWLFWARERAEIDYTQYEFYRSRPDIRRQAAAPHASPFP